jgi:hypothetical protein
MFVALKRVKHQMRACPSCARQTEQFQTGVQYLEKKEKVRQNVVGFWYTCENCGRKNLVDKFCHKCGASMPAGDLTCSNCGAKFKLY